MMPACTFMCVLFILVSFWDSFISGWKSLESGIRRINNSGYVMFSGIWNLYKACDFEEFEGDNDEEIGVDRPISMEDWA